ncbi:P44/Msp2 family outer membrane protein [Anaplasma phagocytophilum]|uniref:P44/Msp2 family outer membrane protein n=1 Tax=Anaplasma phagocytophilum TaxID=948 RepID=UPI00357155D4
MTNTDGVYNITPKLAYRLKAGLSYQLSPEISAFAGGFYHRVVGDGVYDDLPAQRLLFATIVCSSVNMFVHTLVLNLCLQPPTWSTLGTMVVFEGIGRVHL